MASLNGQISSRAYSILVMDDEKNTRDLAASMLEYLGCNVTTCSNGEEAIALYRKAKESGHPYRSVIMDVAICGGMGGKDAAEQILQIDPNARLIVSSSYADNPVMVNHRNYGFRALLQKPYKVSGLAEVLVALNSVVSSGSSQLRATRDRQPLPGMKKGAPADSRTSEKDCSVNKA